MQLMSLMSVSVVRWEGWQGGDQMEQTGARATLGPLPFRSLVRYLGETVLDFKEKRD